jgi:sterol desaturase/sphingolipid hydroxylase (fatty acid hydroxylase superfamily)
VAKKARLTRDREVRLYKNPILESLTRVHPAVPGLVWGPLAIGLIVLGYVRGVSLAGVVGLTIFAVFCWTLTEYVLHRWVFHWEPKNEKLREFFYPVHQLHHDVQEWDRLLMPPMLAVPLALLLFGLFYALLGTPTLFPFYGGFLIGYLIYDYIHFYTHFVTPRSAIGKGLRKRHLQHHFSAEDAWYGVSSPLWDYVFRTHVPSNAVPSDYRRD